MRSLEPVQGRDPEGVFYLSEAEKAEARRGDGERARQLYGAAAGETRDDTVRALAHFRLAALGRREDAGEQEIATSLRASVSLLDDDGRRTREGLFARTLLADAEDAPLIDDLLSCLGGPDGVIALGMLRQLGAAVEHIDARHLDLERMSRLRRDLPRLGPGPSGARLLDGRLVAWQRAADGSLRLAETPVPDLPPGAAVGSSPVALDKLSEEALVASIPRLRTVASVPRSEVAAEANRRALVLGAALALLVAGGAFALWMTLRAARRVAAAARVRTAFVTQVGHDLRTPIANIRLYAETLAEGRVSDQEAAEFAGVAAREAARVSSMVEKILEVSRLDQGPRRDAAAEVDVGVLLGDVVMAHRPLLEEAGIRVVVEVGDDPLLVSGWTDALKGALGNLVENVLKHGASGGVLELGAASVDGRVVIRVADRGPGLPPELGDRVFERFVRGPHTRAGGCGLGLALVREVAVAHHGDVDARDRDGGGVEFRMLLPGALT